MPAETAQPVIQNKPLQAEKMVMKKWFRSLQPVQLYVILTITLFFFLVQMLVSHVTHALTLLVDAYHVLCNLIALFGCIITLKYGTEDSSKMEDSKSQKSDFLSNKSLAALPTSCSRDGHTSSCVHPASETRLKNTFGWARIEVLVMLIVSVFLASLCFSLIVESIQTLIHIDHHDEMHNPIQVLSVGAAGLLLNGIAYLLIGGYTFHQGSYLHVTASGDIILQKKARKAAIQGKPQSSHRKFVSAGPIMAPPKRQGPREVCRDIIGCILVMICSVTVYFCDPWIAKFVDPIFSIVSALLLLFLSYPYMKESCLILLQTIPDHINIDSLRSQLLEAFPDIVNVHDLHVWQLTVNKTFSTAHIIFLNPQEYSRIKKEVLEFFHEQGVTQVTIQPEFFRDSNSIDLVSGYGAGQCLVQCNDEECYKRACCTMDEELKQVVTKSPSISPRNSTVDGCSKPTSEGNQKKDSIGPILCEKIVCAAAAVLNATPPKGEEAQPNCKTDLTSKPYQEAAAVAQTKIEGGDQHDQKLGINKKLDKDVELDHINQSQKNITRCQKESQAAVTCCQKNSQTQLSSCSVEINRVVEREDVCSNVEAHAHIINECCQEESDKTSLCTSSPKICIVKEQAKGKNDKKTKNESEQVT